MKKAHALILTGVAIAAAGVFFVARKTTEQAVPAVHARAATSVEKVSSAGAPPAASPGSGLPAPAQLDSAHDYASAPDLESYLANLPDAGNGNVALARAHAIEECGALRNRPAFVAELIDAHKLTAVPNLETVERYASRTVARCKSFNTNGHAELKDLDGVYLQAEKEGSQAAKARNLMQDAQMSAALPSGPIDASDLQPVIVDLLSSGDPDTVLALSNLMGPTSRFKGAAAGSDMADAAWKLVACDFGLDCSHGSVLLRGYCLNGGMYCGDGDLRANMINSGFSPEAYARVQELEHVIYQAMREGNVASLFDKPE